MLTIDSALEAKATRVLALVETCDAGGLAKLPGKKAALRGTFRRDACLWVGEAPGPDEATSGFPFTGRAGQLLQRWIDQFSGLMQEEWLLTNTVCAMPRDDAGAHFRQPRAAEQRACEPHLRAIIDAVQPRPVIAVGKVAGLALLRMQVPHLSIPHPAFYLRVHDDWRPAVQRLTREIRAARMPVKVALP